MAGTKVYHLMYFATAFQYASEVHSYNTRYATPKKLYKPRVRTNTGKKMISSKAIDLWKSVPQNLKDLNVYLFRKLSKNSYSQSNSQRNLSLEIKYYLLTCPLYLYYIFTTIVIFNDVFFRFSPLFVFSPVTNVTSIGNMVAN